MKIVLFRIYNGKWHVINYKKDKALFGDSNAEIATCARFNDIHVIKSSNNKGQIKVETAGGMKIASVKLVTPELYKSMIKHDRICKICSKNTRKSKITDENAEDFGISLTEKFTHNIKVNKTEDKCPICGVNKSNNIEVGHSSILVCSKCLKSALDTVDSLSAGISVSISNEWDDHE